MRSFVKPTAKRLWRLLDYAGRGLAAWTIIGALGLAGFVTGLIAWALLTLDVMPTPILIVLSIALFLLAASSAGLGAPYLLDRLPARHAASPSELQAPSLARYRAENIAPPLTETEGVALRNWEKVVRSDVQSLMDELHSVGVVIEDALADSGGFWDKPLEMNVWPNVREKLMSEPGFHPAYAATRDAWHAILRAEKTRLEHDEKEPFPLDWEESRIRTALKKINSAENELWRFLGDMS